jgi:threonyl-tRNA synthetase
VSHAIDAYAEHVAAALHEAGLYVLADTSDATLSKKIRTAELAHTSFILVVGAAERDAGTVNARKASAEAKDVVLSLPNAISQLVALKANRVLNAHLQEIP